MSETGALVKLVDPNSLLEIKKLDDFLEIVNSEPPRQLVRSHPMQTGVKYLPIDKVEMMLTKLFQQWHVEILREGQLLNSIYVTVRLHFKHPVTGEWTYQDGTGAVPAKTQKGAKASDMNSILSDAVATGLPAAESYAVKDAAEKIGKLFGRDLNRKETISFSPSYSKDIPVFDYVAEIEKATQDTEFKTILEKLTAEQKLDAAPLIEKRRKELRNATASTSGAA